MNYSNDPIKYMKLDFYGVKTHPPTLSTAKAFGSTKDPILLKGGQGTSYVSGDIVLKPAENIDEANWMAEVFNNLPETNDARFAKPIKATDGTWVHDGYVSWTFLKGEHVKGHYDKKLPASRAYHNLLKDVVQPDFLKTPRNSWSTGDSVAWHEEDFQYDEEFMELFGQIKPHLKPTKATKQLIHGDLSGNFLVAESLPVAIIDFSPAWAPSGFAEGIMLVDAVAWENAKPEDLEIFKQIPDIDQFAWRGALRRITEQAEHIQWLGKDKDQAVQEARAFQKAIDYLKMTFK